MEQLKPCPFCGGEAEIRSYQYIFGKQFWVFCRGCGLTTPEQLDEKTAIKLWNRRVSNG